MEDKNQNEKFQYSYSAKEQTEIRKIREKYVAKESDAQENKMEQLRRLDHGVTKKATVWSLVIGVIGSLILGVGMCCCLVWGDRWFFSGVLIGLLGIVNVSLAYPVYAWIVKREREKITPEILRLTDELMK